jgi:hypothetical protein
MLHMLIFDVVDDDFRYYDVRTAPSERSASSERSGASNALFVLSKSCTFMVDSARDVPHPWTSHRGGAHARLVNPGEAATSPQQASATGQRRREVEEDPNL